MENVRRGADDMHELVTTSSGEQYWQKALLSGLERVVVSHRGNENQLLGRVFEYLGYAFVSDVFPPPEFVLTTPQDTAYLKRYITEDEMRRWQPCFPDGIVFQRTDIHGSLKIAALVEYKVSNPMNTEKQGYQFDGFVNLLRLLRHNNALRGKDILRKYFKRKIPHFEVSQDVEYIYVVPQGRTAVDTPTSLYGVASFREMVFPQSPKDIRRRIRKIRALNNLI